jgi:YVTN family beta-propeller protein
MKLQRRPLWVAGFFSMVMLFALAATAITTHAQDVLPISYGDTVNGQVTASKNTVAYSFDAQEGDVVTITMTRTSGNLRPEVAIGDLSQPQGKRVLVIGELSSDGKTATISEFTMPHAGNFVILATREGVDTGTTTGKYKLSLEGTGGGDNPTEPTATATKKPRASSTPRVKATPTPAEEPTETSVAEPTETPGDNAEGVETFKVGKSPNFSTWSGSNLYVSNAGDGTVSILNSDGKVTGTIKVGGVPFAMAWDGTRLWVADLGTDNRPGNSVNLFDAKGKKVATYEVGYGPFSLSYDKDNEQMWIALYDENKIIAVDSGGNIGTTIDTDTNPNTVLWTGTKLWATLAGPAKLPGNTVIAIDTDGNITGTYKVGKSPADLAWDEDDQLLFVANYDDDNVMALDADGKVVGTYDVGKGPGALAWDGTHLWVTLSLDKAVVALSKDGEVLKSIPLDAAPNGVAWDGTYIWVAGAGTSDEPGNTVTRIDVETVLGSQ